MGGEGRRGSVDDLIGELRAAGTDRARVIAILWTWLERHLRSFGRLGHNGSEIRKAAGASKEPTAIDEERLSRLRGAPLENAAMLLAELHAELERGSGTDLVEVTRGIDDEEVFVVWRDLSAAALTRPDDLLPPSAEEHPSLTALAPRIVVCPVEHDDFELDILRPDDELDESVAYQWGYARALLGAWIGGETSLSVHLDTLEEHGLSGWRPDGDRLTVVFRDDEIEAADEAACIAAAQRAVCKAADWVRAAEEAVGSDLQGPPAVLLLPELAATDKVRREIAAELARQDHPPALTVVGLYHLPADSSDVDPELVGDSRVAGWTNEAVVLGPTGVELWRHRKLSKAEAELPVKGSDGVVRELKLGEDVQPGNCLRMVQTPVGTVAVVVCLDSFKDDVRGRLLASPADFLLVPSLSPSTHRHQNSLQELVQRQWGMAFVCNRTVLPHEPGETVWNEDRHRSFWALQRAALKIPNPKGDGEHPSFVFELSSYVKPKAGKD